MTDRFYIDGKDAFTEYGVFVQEDGYNELVAFPSLKSVKSNDWQEEDGIAVHVLTEAQCGAFQALTDRLYDPEDPDHQEWFAECTPEWMAQFRPS